jgi:hypothetical protein
MPDIAFNVRLAEADWDDTMSGWRCPALNVPGAKVESIYVEGTRVDSAKYEVLQSYAIIRWAAGDRPTRATASIILTSALSLETETDRWRRLAIVLPVIATIIAALISGGATYLAKKNPTATVSAATTSTNETTVTFVNKTGALVNLYWDSGSGQPTKYPDIENGASYSVHTYGGAHWIARSVTGQELLNYTQWMGISGPLKLISRIRLYLDSSIDQLFQPARICTI